MSDFLIATVIWAVCFVWAWSRLMKSIDKKEVNVRRGESEVGVTNGT